MDFILSKLLWLAVNPGNLLLILLSAGVFMLFLRRKAAWGRRLVALAALLLVLLSILPLGQWLFVSLENRFPTPSYPERVDGIVVLGGFVDTVMSHKSGRIEVGGSVERLFALIELAKRYPDARLVFSGGSGSVLHPEAREAPLVENLLKELGFPTERVVFEDRSRNTVENALFSKELAKPQAGESWLLVTSAAHMPRAVGCFRRQNWPVLAWPVDHVSDGTMALDLDFNLAGRAGLLGAAIHEWLGLVSYYLMDRTDSLFPAP